MDPEKKKIHNRLWRRARRATDPEFRAKDCARSREYYRKNKSRCRLANRAWKFKLTKEQVEVLLSKPVCDICSLPPEPGKSLHIDHNHVTGEVRGVLCMKCNFALGCLRDCPSTAEKASKYLKKFAPSLIPFPIINPEEYYV